MWNVKESNMTQRCSTLANENIVSITEKKNYRPTMAWGGLLPLPLMSGNCLLSGAGLGGH